MWYKSNQFLLWKLAKEIKKGILLWLGGQEIGVEEIEKENKGFSFKS